MSDMKCPFCQDTLIPCIKNQNDWIYHCDNQKCPMYDDADNENAKHLLASKDLWQELIRTRKALDVAKLILKNLLPDLNGYERLDVEKAIAEITALEQKD